MTYSVIYPTLYLLRHGQTEWNVEGRLQGRLDSALTETGVAQAHAQRAILAPILTAHPGIAIHASPLGRAWRTASIVAEGRAVQAMDGLKEVSAGTWEGRLRADVVAERGYGSAEEKDMFSLFLTAPNGEGGAALESRCRAYLESLTQPTVIVSHGVVSAFLRGIICGLSIDEIAALPHVQGVVTVLSGHQARVLETPEAAEAYVTHALASDPPAA
tara:strand:+ start:38350 stop:38997 length:648 start_codon:yes stop_codon:yes gene_type:complete